MDALLRDGHRTRLVGSFAPGSAAALSMNECSCDNKVMSHGADSDLAFLSAQTARSVAESMQALATPSRVRILSRLSAGPCSVGELATQVQMEQSAVSQQLRVLRHLGLVVGERAGRRVIYALHDDHVRALLTEAVSHTEHLRLGLAASPAQEALAV
jgi:ArsR family transcriptional regulator, nickel/cobalt-responsive transcriptional repressor